MFNYQEVRIAGNLGADPEIRCKANAGDNAYIVNLRVGVTESWKDKSSGDWKDRTEWFRVVKFNVSKKAADFFTSKLRKGSNVWVAGVMRTRNWDDNGETKYITELVADKIEKIQDAGGKSSRSEDAHTDSAAQDASQRDASTGTDDPFGDDVEF